MARTNTNSGGSGGLTQVYHDSTLTGLGTSGSPLGVVGLTPGGNFLIGQTSGIISNPSQVTSNGEVFLGEGAGNLGSTSGTVFIGHASGAGATSAAYSIFMGEQAGLNASSALQSVFLGAYAGYGATSANDSVFLGFEAGNNATSAQNSVFLGTNAGDGATGADHSIFQGVSAGQNATSANYSNFLGNLAGAGSRNAYLANFIGYFAGRNATNANNGNFIGDMAGYNATNASYSNFIGYTAGQSATGASSSNFIGYQAGTGATNAQLSNFIGPSAGYGATGATNSNFIGNSAGSGAAGASQSNFIGYQAGLNATNANHSDFIGFNAGSTATNADHSIFLGYQAGKNATNASKSFFGGQNAGFGATGASNSVIIGNAAGQSATGATDSVFIGPSAGNNAPNAAHTIAIGFNAGFNDTVNNLTSGYSSIIIGENSTTGGFSNSIAFGANTQNTSSNELVVGSATVTNNTIRNIKLGDHGNKVNGTAFLLNDATQTITNITNDFEVKTQPGIFQTTLISANGTGGSQEVIIGDVSHTNGGVALKVGNLSNSITAYGGYNTIYPSKLLDVNFLTGVIGIGDLSGSNHSTNFTVDDTNQIIIGYSHHYLGNQDMSFGVQQLNLPSLSLSSKGTWLNSINTVTADQAFVGVGDTTPIGGTNEAAVMGHITTDADIGSFIIDYIAGAPWLQTIAQLGSAPTAGMEIFMNDHSWSVGNRAGGGNSTTINLDDTTATIELDVNNAFTVRAVSGAQTIFANNSTLQVQLGDTGGTGNGTIVNIEDASKLIQINGVHVRFPGLQSFANNAAAIAGSLVSGDAYLVLDATTSSYQIQVVI